MAILNFPNTDGQPIDGSFTYQDNGVLYIWDGYKWTADAGSSGGNGNHTDGPTPPTTGEVADQWYNTDDGRLYTYTEDSSGTLVWIDASPDSIAGDGGSGGGGGGDIYWTRDGTTLKPANESDDVVTGNYNPTDNSSKGCEIGAGAITAQRLPNEGTTTLFRGLKGNDINFEVTADGSGNFVGPVKSGPNYDNVYLKAGKGDGTGGSKLTVSARPGPAINDNVLEINTYPNSNTNKSVVFAVTYAGNVMASGTIGFYLEADDDTKYTATTDAEGNETRVYNGEVLDVKELLLTLRTAASRITTLEAEVQSLKGGN